MTFSNCELKTNDYSSTESILWTCVCWLWLFRAASVTSASLWRSSRLYKELQMSVPADVRTPLPRGKWKGQRCNALIPPKRIPALCHPTRQLWALCMRPCRAAACLLSCCWCRAAASMNMCAEITLNYESVHVALTKRRRTLGGGFPIMHCVFPKCPTCRLTEIFYF